MLGCSSWTSVLPQYDHPTDFGQQTAAAWTATIPLQLCSGPFDSSATDCKSPQHLILPYLRGHQGLDVGH